MRKLGNTIYAFFIIVVTSAIVAPIVIGLYILSEKYESVTVFAGIIAGLICYAYIKVLFDVLREIFRDDEEEDEKDKPTIVYRHGFDEPRVIKDASLLKEIGMNHNDDIIKVNLSQAGSNNNDLMHYVTQLKQSGIIIDLISENYVEPSSWNSLVVFTMNPDDLYKIPDIVDHQLIIDVITDDDDNFTTKEIAVIVYNNYIE